MLLHILIFHLFIDHCTTKIKCLNCGIPFDYQSLSILMDAGDIGLLSNSANGHQEMLNSLHSWGDENNMVVNLEKSKIGHFRKWSETSQTVLPFTNREHCDSVGIVKEYKYLVLFLNDFNDFNITAKHVDKSAGRALSLFID